MDSITAIVVAIVVTIFLVWSAYIGYLNTMATVELKEAQATYWRDK